MPLPPGTKNPITSPLPLFFVLFKTSRPTKTSTNKSEVFYPTISTLAYLLKKGTSSFYPFFPLLLFPNYLNLRSILLLATRFMKVRKSKLSGRTIFCMADSQILD